MYELTFGTVCGICAGVFVKKGAKALAVVFGGVFVLLQVSVPALLHILARVRSDFRCVCAQTQLSPFYE